MAGRVCPSALQNFGIFPDSGMAYTPHRPKIAGYLSTKEIPHTGMAGFLEAEVGRVVGKRGEVTDQAFFPRGFLMRLVSTYAFSYIRRDDCDAHGLL